ncbi:hypothetical protein FDK38_002903 [Candidozyma auris]|nr:hypothetical protein FDK38_002903 [[Candida] auris]
MQHARWSNSRQATSPLGENDNLTTYLRSSPETRTPMGRLQGKASTLTVGNMSLNTPGSTLTVGKNKVTTSGGLRSTHTFRSFTDPIAHNIKSSASKHIHSGRNSVTPSKEDSTSDEPMQLTVWFHEPRSYTEDVVIDASAVPGMKQGGIYSLEPVTKDVNPQKEDQKRFIFAVSKHNFIGESSSKNKSNLQISLQSNPLQKLLDIPPRSQVLVQKVKDTSEVELDTVEIYLKDVNFPRDSQWGLASSFVGTCCYIDQRVLYLGNKIGQVRSTFKDGRKLFSGYVSKKTNIIFRSESAKLIFLVQMSREMWHFEENGEIMFHKLVNTLFPKIFKNWLNASSHHAITIVLFTSIDLTHIPWISLGAGECPTKTQDYYRVVVDQVSVFSWDKIMASLRLEFANFKRDVLMHLVDGQYRISGEPCPSVKGNFLEAVNLTISLVCDRFRNTDLRHTVNHIIVITPGTGLYDVDYDLMLKTSKKMFSLDCALDIVSLSQPPLHTVPLLRYRDDDGHVGHCVPKWCDISFYTDTDEWASQWIPRCKIYELQMMGVMENEVNEVRIDRLQLSKKIPIVEAMDRYDEDLFRPIEFSRSNSSKLEHSEKKVSPKHSTATLVLMGKASLASLSTPRLEPDQSSSNVCTTTAAVQGTVSNSSANVSALSSLYTLNRSNDDPKKKNIFASRDMRSMSQIKDTYPKSGSMPSRDLVVRPTILKSRESKKTDRRGKAKEASKILKNKGKNVTSTQEKERDERSRNNPYWMKIDNPSREMASDSIRCSRWADVFPPRIKRKLVKWRSLKAPAALPIATSLFPSPKELESEYTFQIYVVSLSYDNKLELKCTKELMREMIRLRLAIGFQICKGERVRNAELERKPSGSPEALIHYMPQGDCTGARIYLSLNDEIHRIFCDYNGTLNVQLYRRTRAHAKHSSFGRKRRDEAQRPFIRTRYADEYTTSLITSQDTEPFMYNWNQFDQLLAGYDDTISETREFHKMKFVVMPADMSQSAYHVNNDSLSDEEIRVEGLRKLISLIERGRYSQSAEKPTKKKEEILPEISFYTGNLYDFLNEQAEVFLTSGTQPQNSLMVSDSKFNTNIKLQVLAERLQAPGGLNLVDRTWHFKVHPSCFLGQELVSWLIEYFEDIDNRDEATSYGQDLMNEGLFTHVDNRHGFLDGHYFYEFTESYTRHSNNVKQPSGGWFRKKTTNSSDKSVNTSTISPKLTAQVSNNPSHTRDNSDTLSVSAIDSNTSKKMVSSSLTKNDSESSSLAESQNAKKLKKFMISKHVRYDCDPLRKSFRPELLDVHYDRVHNPEHCYHIRLQWLNTTNKFIDETIVSWSRLCERYGLKLVETPWRELCTIPKLNPFHSFVDLKLVVNPMLDPEFNETTEFKENRFYYHLFLLKRTGFLLDNRGSNFFSRDNIEIQYSWGLPAFKYAQFIHRTGAYIVELRDNGDFFMAPNNVHILRVNTLITSIPEQSSTLKNYAFDSQKVMMDFRESCKDEVYLRSLFREAMKGSRENYDYMIA